MTPLTDASWGPLRRRGPPRSPADLELADSRLVDRILRRYGLTDDEDALSEGWVALCRAAREWRPDGGSGWPSFAWRFVEDAVSRYLRKIRLRHMNRLGDWPVQQQWTGPPGAHYCLNCGESRIGSNVQTL